MNIEEFLKGKGYIVGFTEDMGFGDLTYLLEEFENALLKEQAKTMVATSTAPQQGAYRVMHYGDYYHVELYDYHWRQMEVRTLFFNTVKYVKKLEWAAPNMLGTVIELRSKMSRYNFYQPLPLYAVPIYPFKSKAEALKQIDIWQSNQVKWERKAV